MKTVFSAILLLYVLQSNAYASQYYVEASLQCTQMPNTQLFQCEAVEHQTVIEDHKPEPPTSSIQVYPTPKATASPIITVMGPMIRKFVVEIAKSVATEFVTSELVAYYKSHYGLDKTTVTKVEVISAH